MGREGWVTTLDCVIIGVPPEEVVLWVRSEWKEKTGHTKTWSRQRNRRTLLVTEGGRNSSEKAWGHSIIAEWEAALSCTTRGRFCPWTTSYKVCILSTVDSPSPSPLCCPGAIQNLSPKLEDSSLKESERPQGKDLRMLTCARLGMALLKFCATSP